MPRPLSPCILVLIGLGLASAAEADLRSGDLAEVNRSIQELRVRGDQASLQQILDGLANPHPEVVARVVEALPDFGAKAYAHAPTLRDMAERDNVLIQRSVAKSLGEFRDDQALDPLIRLLESDDPTTKRSARDALKTIARSDLGTDPAIWRRWQDNWLEKRDTQVMPIAERLRNGSSENMVKDLHKLLFNKTHRTLVAETLYDVARTSKDPTVLHLVREGLKNQGSFAADYLLDKAGAEGAWVPLAEGLPPPATPDPDPDPVSPATATIDRPPPQEDSGWGGVLFFAALAIGLISLVGLPMMQMYRKSHQAIGERTARFRRNKGRIEINF